MRTTNESPNPAGDEAVGDLADLSGTPKASPNPEGEVVETGDLVDLRDTPNASPNPPGDVTVALLVGNPNASTLAWGEGRWIFCVSSLGGALTDMEAPY